MTLLLYVFSLGFCWVETRVPLAGFDPPYFLCVSLVSIIIEITCL